MYADSVVHSIISNLGFKSDVLFVIIYALMQSSISYKDIKELASVINFNLRISFKV